MEHTATPPLNAAPAEAEASTAPVRVWDAPVRLIHWLAVASFAGAWLTAEADGLRGLHILFGLSLIGLMAVRVLWGLVGSPTARFAHFVRGPAAVAAHFHELARGTARPHAGHNPAGGWAVLALIGLSLGVGLSGWLTWDVAERFEDLHEALAEGLLLLVALHVAAVLVTSWLTRDKLLGAMFSGRKALDGEAGIPRAYKGVAALILTALLGFWAWGLGPNTPFQGEGAGESHEVRGDKPQHHAEDDEDDDD